jgi:hypothetical protein
LRKTEVETQTLAHKLLVDISNKYKNLEKNNKNQLSTNHHLGTGSGLAAQI